MSLVCDSPIRDFYKDSVIFITGVTGYVGSGLLEKLLRTCQNIRRIYILVRNKKGKSSKERMNEVFNSPYFDQLKRENKNYMDYFRIIDGDLEEDKLGISSSDWNILTKEVNVVFHIAATVRFDEKLKIAAKLNVLATKHIIELCKQSKNLKSFVYVSTAYSNTNRTEIKETFYPPPIDPIDFLELTNKKSDQELDELKPKLVEGFPNTYTYTKCLAEELVRREIKNFPTCVVRPAIVMGPWGDPFRGYSPNLNGPYGIMLAIGMGLLHTMRVEPSHTVEMVPLDMLVNLMLAAAFNTANTHHKQDVYNFTSGNQNRLTWGEYFGYCLDFAEHYVFKDAFWLCYFLMIQNKIWLTIVEFVLHTVPAVLVDYFMILTGKKPRLRKIYEKLNKGIELLEIFTMREWQFTDDNTQQLYASLDDTDKQLFNFNVKDIEWDLFCLYNCRALRVHLVKDPLSTVKLARQKQRRFKRISIAIGVLGIIMLYYFINILISKIMY